MGDTEMSVGTVWPMFRGHRVPEEWLCSPPDTRRAVGDPGERWWGLCCPNLCKPPAAPWAKQSWAERNGLLVCGELLPPFAVPAIAAPVSGFLQDDALDTGPVWGCSGSFSAGNTFGTLGSSQLGEAASPPFFVHNCRQGEAELGWEPGLCLHTSLRSLAGLSLAGLSPGA